MDAITYVKGQLEQAFGIMNVSAAGMTDEQYNFNAGGTCNTPAKSHVHAASSIDFFINLIIGQGKTHWDAVAKAHGLPESPLAIWQHEAPIPFAPIDQYSKDVQNAALEVVSKLTADDLDREFETNFIGKKSGSFLLQLTCVHVTGHGGDIAAIKGMQGLKGLPF